VEARAVDKAPAKRRRLVAACAVLVLRATAAAYGGEGVAVTFPPAVPGAPARIFYVKDVAQVEAARCGHDWLRPLRYLWLAPGAAGSVLLALRGRRWLAALLVCGVPLFVSLGDDPRAAVRAGVQAVVGGKYLDAARLFGAADAGDPCSHVLAYDRALCAFALGQRADAVAYLLRCLAAAPGNAEYAQTFAAVSTDYGLESQVVPRGVRAPSAVFAAGLVAANLALVALGLLFARGGGQWVITSSLLLLAVAAAAALLVHTELQLGAPLAVVAADTGALRRVPLEQARVWMALPRGTSVRIRGRAAPFVLVETGLRVEGWIREDALLRAQPARPPRPAGSPPAP
jgi:hypothetical protein